jgi:PAS domain S-box-containing protein
MTLIRLLYIDDEESMLVLGTAYLRRSGKFEVETALSGEIALEKFKKGHFDAIISDYRMVGMSGIELLKEVRKSSSVPFILFTGRGREEVAIQAMENGADFYLQKGNDSDAMYAELEHKVLAAVERRQAREALAAGEERYRALIETTGTGFAVLDGEGAVCEANCEFVRMTGRASKDEVLGRHVLEWTTPYHREPTLQAFQDLLRTGRLRHYEVDYAWPDGTVVPVEVNATTISLGGRTLAIGLVRDITHIREAEARLRESGELYRNLVEHSQDGVFIIQDGRIVFSNAAFAAIAGYTREEVNGMEITRLIAPEHRDMVMDRYRRRQAGETVEDHYEFMVLHKDGETRSLVSMDVGIITHGGRVASMGTIRDITDQRAAEEALSRTNRKMHLMSSLTRHDLSNLVTALQGSLDLTRAEPDPARRETFLDEADGIIRQISRHLAFTAIYQYLGEKEPSWQDLGTVIAAVASGSHGMPVELDLAPLEVLADPMLGRVFSNLVENTRLHGRGATRGRFLTETGHGRAVIIYEDDGCGIPAPDKERVFEQGVGKHTGFGLFLAREILGITGITIRETGEPGKGARFEMSVPEGKYRVTGTMH